MQFFAKVLSLVVAFTMVMFFYRAYFEGLKLFPPASRALAATARAAADPQLARWLPTWAQIGFVLQLLGGPERQIGILLATGLMILNAPAGIAVLVTIAARLILMKVYGIENLRGVLRRRSWSYRWLSNSVICDLHFESLSRA
ncbi:MAG: hypothetical protein RMH84_02685 [Sulfolobales archaeon]|nr:hypothetical protein [Sulfolobales archaeon]MCX8208759.1 hypothetical protein [Sulfolobales archaeon]MDW8010482.1 hypothetical protein [Sulfolobales archaeon]